MHRNELITTFFDLVKIDSPTGEEKQIAVYIEKLLKDLECSLVKRDQSNTVFATIAGKGEPLFFTAHLDTVEPGRNIKPQMSGAYLTSDGTTILGGDDKVAVTAIIETIRFVQHKKHRPLEIILTTSEESGNYGSIAFDVAQLQSTKGYCFDLSQPLGSYALSSPYYERFDIMIKGKAAHGSRPEEGHNVLSVLQKLFLGIPVGRIDEETTCNIGLVHVGDARNTVPGHAMLKGEIRSLQEEKLEEQKEIIRRIIVKENNSAIFSITEDWLRENPGYKHTSSAANAFIQETEKVLRSLSLQPKSFAGGGVSDANIFNDRGLLCLNLSDATEFSHTVHERIKITDYEKLVALMIALVTQ